MEFDAGKFSRDLKIQKLNYISEDAVDFQLLDTYEKGLKEIDLFGIRGDKEKIAFWINVYNGMTNLIIIRKKIKKSMMEKPLIFSGAQIQIGDYVFSLDHIEHGILRLNRRATYKPYRQFWPWDKRLKLAPSSLDYRIHFALNCGGNSCPPIAFYTAENLEAQLQLAEENFAHQEFIVDEKNKTLSASLIFKAYKKDFPNKYLNDPKYKNYKVKINSYDWSIIEDS